MIHPAWLVPLALLIAVTTACQDKRYAGPPDPGDVEMELQIGGFIFVPVQEIRTYEPSDTGTLVWVEGDSFVVRDSVQTLKERIRQAERELQDLY